MFAARNSLVDSYCFSTTVNVCAHHFAACVSLLSPSLHGTAADARLLPEWRHALTETLHEQPPSSWHLLKLLGQGASMQPQLGKDGAARRRACANRIFACNSVGSSALLSFGTAAVLMHSDNASIVLRALEKRAKTRIAVDVALADAYLRFELDMADSIFAAANVTTEFGSTQVGLTPPAPPASLKHRNFHI